MKQSAAYRMNWEGKAFRQHKYQTSGVAEEAFCQYQHQISDVTEFESAFFIAR